ncbi:MAG TPA: hypothetical protein VLB75_12415 [Steroidobacteraceae bacterium]|nr:hypothetical protein [Steroidobacteraceae bacterium]
MKLSLLKTIVTLLVTMNLAWTSACTSMQSVPMPGHAQVPAVAVGEEVSVTRVDGQKLTFKVTAVEPDALVGAGVRVRYQDIAKLEVRRHDRNETGTVVAVLGGAVMIALGYALSHIPPPMMGP